MAKYKSKSESPAISSDDKWRVESDLRTCTEYHLIQKDPKRMAAVRKLAREQVAALKIHTGEK